MKLKLASKMGVLRFFFSLLPSWVAYAQRINLSPAH